MDVVKVLTLFCLWAACLASFFVQPTAIPRPSAEAARQALNDAFARAVGSCACTSLPAARAALAAATPSPPDAPALAALASLDAATSRCADVLDFSSGGGLGARLFGECLGRAGVTCYALEAALRCPSGLPCFADAVAADLAAADPAFADAFAAAQAALQTQAANAAAATSKDSE